MTGTGSHQAGQHPAEHALRLALIETFSSLMTTYDCSQVELAERLELSESQMSRLMNGQVFPSVRLLMHIEDIEPGFSVSLFVAYRRQAWLNGASGYRATRTTSAKDRL